MGILCDTLGHPVHGAVRCGTLGSRQRIVVLGVLGHLLGGALRRGVLGVLVCALRVLKVVLGSLLS